MKTLLKLIIAFTVLAMTSNVHAQTVQIKDKAVKDTTVSGNTYKLYVGSRGGRYIIMKSKTTGKEYKRYFKKH